MPEREIFRNYTPDFQRLEAFGFARRGELWNYTAPVADGQLLLTVTVSARGKVTARVSDAASGEEYVLHRVAGVRGSFVGRVKADCETVLQEIRNRCFARDVFHSGDARTVIRYVRETYGDELEFLWARSPQNAVWRRKDNQKWYGALLTVAPDKLGLDGKESMEILDLRIDPQRMEAVLDGRHCLPGYHMNKKSWFTVCLDGSLPAERIFRWIDDSYRIAAKK